MKIINIRLIIYDVHFFINVYLFNVLLVMKIETFINDYLL